MGFPALTDAYAKCRRRLVAGQCRLGDEGEAAPAVLTPVVLVVWADCERGMRAVSQYGLA